MSNDTSITLLYGDKTPALRAVLQAVFKNSGDSITVYHRSSAIDILSELKNGQIDLLVLSLELEDIGGLELCHEIRSLPGCQRIPILMFGPMKEEELILTALRAGASDYLSTPFRRAELVAKARYYGELSMPQNQDSPQLFQDRYEKVELLGQGGFGAVHLAIDQSYTPPRQVALKTYNIQPGDGTFRSRFLQEAFQLSRLHHSNIVRLIDFGKTSSNYYLVTEYVEGQTLSEALNSTGPLTEHNAALVGYFVGMAIQHMSQMRMIHRDLNPSNIMISKDGEIKVVDFGLAKTVMAQTLSSTGEFQGTAYYVAPEFIVNEPATEKTDLYSLAITLYVCLTDRYPFPGNTTTEVLQAHLSHIPTPLIELLPEIDTNFSDLISRCLAPTALDRPEISEFILFLKSMIEA